MNFAAIVAEHAASQPRKTAVESSDELLSYGDLDGLAARIAGRLRRSGAGVGDLVATRLLDSPIHVASLLAVTRIGAIVLPIDWRSTTLEVRRIVDRFRPRLLLTDNQRPIPEDLRPIGLEGIEDEPADVSPPVALSDAPLVYALTSGTTGESKGVVVTHEEMFERSVVFGKERMMEPGDRFLPAMPLAYAAGREFHCSLLIHGATIVKLPSLFTAEELAATVKQKDISAVLVPPNVSRQLLELQTGRGDYLLPDLRAYVSSTGKLTPEERSAIRARLSPNLIDFYGSTGSGPISAIAGPQDEPDITSAGHITFGIDVEIAGEDGKPLSCGEIGAVRLRGPRITKRFIGDVDTVSEGIVDGWYYPGDLASIDENGLLHLHGRSADLIKRAGFMVHALEVERILMLHEAVVEAAVVGIPSADVGEEVGAFVVIKSEADIRELMRHCTRHLAPYKVPSRIEVIDELPRNASGKVQKALIKETLLGGSPPAGRHSG